MRGGPGGGKSAPRNATFRPRRRRGTRLFVRAECAERWVCAGAAGAFSTVFDCFRPRRRRETRLSFHAESAELTFFSRRRRGTELPTKKNPANFPPLPDDFRPSPFCSRGGNPGLNINEIIVCRISAGGNRGLWLGGGGGGSLFPTNIRHYKGKACPLPPLAPELEP
jgi:hypothetical protein